MELTRPSTPSIAGAHRHDVDRYERILTLQRSLSRAPTVDEVWPILAGMSSLRRYSGIAPAETDTPEGMAPRWRVRRAYRSMLRRVGEAIGAQDVIRDLLGTVADKAVRALDEVLDPATRPANAAMVKSLSDAAIKALQVAGHSREERGGGSVSVTTVVGISRDELAQTSEMRRRIHELEQQQAGVLVAPAQVLPAVEVEIHGAGDPTP